MIRGVVLILLASLLAAPAAEARPDGLATVAMVKQKKLTCKQVKRAKLTRKMSKARRRHLAALKRRCAAAQRRQQSAGGPVIVAPAGGAPATSGSGGASIDPIATPDPGDYTAPLPESNPRALQVVSGEFFLNLSKGAVLSGPVRVEFNNLYAEDPHDLHLVREDGSGPSYAFGQLEAGQLEAKTLDLGKGTWQLFCALPEHASRGMTATLKVSQ
jgi:hypothetical protein